MSSQAKQIVCRNCKETISTASGNCPKCGASIRSDVPYVLGVVLGVVLIGAALIYPSSLLVFGAVGALISISAGLVLYGKRQRLSQAAESV